MDRNKWRINNVNGRTREQGNVGVTLNCILKNASCQSSTQSTPLLNGHTEAQKHTTVLWCSAISAVIVKNLARQLSCLDFRS